MILLLFYIRLKKYKQNNAIRNSFSGHLTGEHWTCIAVQFGHQ